MGIISRPLRRRVQEAVYTKVKTSRGEVYKRSIRSIQTPPPIQKDRSETPKPFLQDNALEIPTVYDYDYSPLIDDIHPKAKHVSRPFYNYLY